MDTAHRRILDLLATSAPSGLVLADVSEGADAPFADDDVSFLVRQGKVFQVWDQLAKQHVIFPRNERALPAEDALRKALLAHMEPAWRQGAGGQRKRSCDSEALVRGGHTQRRVKEKKMALPKRRP